MPLESESRAVSRLSLAGNFKASRLWALGKRKTELNALGRNLLAFDRSVHSGLHTYTCPSPPTACTTYLDPARFA